VTFLYVESCYLDDVSVYIYSVVLWGRGPVVEVGHLDYGVCISLSIPLSYGGHGPVVEVDHLDYVVNIDPLQSLSIGTIGPSSITYVKVFRWAM
jgi:hypothetical protein